MKLYVNTPKQVIIKTLVISAFATTFSFSVTYVAQSFMGTARYPGIFLSILIPLFLCPPVTFIVLVQALANTMRRKEIERLYKELQEERQRRSNAEKQSMELSELLPVCAACKKVRDDKGYWQKVELYMESHLKQKTTHGFCPGCLHDLYPEYADEAINGDTPS